MSENMSPPDTYHLMESGLEFPENNDVGVLGTGRLESRIRVPRDEN